MKARVIQKEQTRVKDEEHTDDFLPEMKSDDVLEFQKKYPTWYMCITEQFYGYHYHISWLEVVED